MFIKSFLRQIFENGFFAQKKQEDKRLFFLFHSFPSSAFHQVTQSPRQMNTIPNQATIPPRFLLLYFLSFHPCHIFNCSAFCSFPSSNPFSFTRLLVASSQQGTKSSKVLAVERFVIRSRVSAILHPPSFFLFSIFMHTSLRAVCFLSVSSSHYFFFLLTSALLLFALLLSLLFSYRSSHFYFSTFPYFLFSHLPNFFFSFIFSKLLCLFSDFCNSTFFIQQVSLEHPFFSL